jgi:hypothetical protein
VSRFARSKALYELLNIRADSFQLQAGDPRVPDLRAVLLELAGLASSDGEVWYGPHELAESNGMGKRQLQRCLTTLERLGFVEVLPRGYRGRWFKTVRLLFGRVAASEQDNGEAQATRCFLRQETRDELRRSYLEARRQRYGITAVPNVPDRVWAELARFVEGLGRELALPFSVAAAHAMRAYLSCQGWDGRLAASHHRIDWWTHYEGAIEATVRRELAKKDAQAARTSSKERAPSSAVRPASLGELAGQAEGFRALARAAAGAALNEGQGRKGSSATAASELRTPLADRLPETRSLTADDAKRGRRIAAAASAPTPARPPLSASTFGG